MFHQRPNFSAGTRIACVVQFEGDGHGSPIVLTASKRCGEALSIPKTEMSSSGMRFLKVQAYR
jgi:hypothetical protein